MAQGLTKSEIESVKGVKRELLGKRRVLQEDLEEFQRLQDAVAEARERSKVAEERFGSFHETLKVKIKSGWPVQVGALTAEIAQTERRTVAWKDVVARRCGAVVVEAEQQQVVPTVTEKVVVRRTGVR